MENESTSANQLLIVWSDDKYNAFDQSDTEEALFNIFSMVISETIDEESTIGIFYC